MGETRGKVDRLGSRTRDTTSGNTGLQYALNHIVTAHPNPTLDAERQAGRNWVPFLPVFGMTRPGIEPTTSQSQGGRSNHVRHIIFEAFWGLTGPQRQGLIVVSVRPRVPF